MPAMPAMGMNMDMDMDMAEEKQSTRLTLVLVNLASIMEKADEALLPAVYNELAAALHTTPLGLGSLTLFRSFVQAACYPLAAYMALRHNRTHVIALGAFLWAAATFLVALSHTFAQLALARALNGLGLALVTPAIQSLVADSTHHSTRGTAFGWLQLTANFGSLFGGFFALMLASTTVMGVQGWRLAFHLVAAVSVLVGLLVRLFATDPRRFRLTYADSDSDWDCVSRKSEIQDLVLEAKAVVKIPSFQIIVAQGVTGSFPWSALAFAPMWLELTGFSHRKTALLMTLFALATSLGGLLGGKLGDSLSLKYPNSGRILLAQFSSASAVPLAALLLLALPDDSHSAFAHGFVIFVMGLTISWNAPATNNPIFAEIVPEKSRTSIYALDRSFESLLASFAPPLVGYLAQHLYGYKPIDDGMPGNTITDRENAISLAKALYTAIAIPMVLCCVIYSFLYKTYPRDRERAKMDSLIASELEHIELVGTEERIMIDVQYGDDDLFDEEEEKNFVPYQVETSNQR